MTRTIAFLLLNLLLLPPAAAAAVPTQPDPFPREAIEIGLGVGACVAAAGISQGLVTVEPGTFPPVLTVLPGKEEDYEALQRRCAGAVLEGER